MNTQESILVIRRMYIALDTVIQQGRIRGVNTFTREHDINRWNFLTVRKKPESDMFQVSWLTYLVNDFGVSATWLLTGRGDMFSR